MEILDSMLAVIYSDMQSCVVTAMKWQAGILLAISFLRKKLHFSFALYFFFVFVSKISVIRQENFVLDSKNTALNEDKDALAGGLTALKVS